MKKTATVELFEPGMVIFDPLVLDEFVKEHSVSHSNLYEVFTSNDEIGRAVVEHGVIFPMYPIPDGGYLVVIDPVENASGFEASFEFTGGVLSVRSGLLVVSDLNALFDWDPRFFTDYKRRYSERLSCNDYLEVPCGSYALNVKGGKLLCDGQENLAYVLCLSGTVDLPQVSGLQSTDGFDFSLGE